MTKEQMEELVQQNMKKIYLFCVSRVGNTTAAEDVASDIILELLRSYEQIKKDDAIYGYLWSVARNLCKNYWRKQAREQAEEIPEDFSGGFAVSLEDSLIHQQELFLLRRELSLLSGKYRSIMIQYYIEGKTCAAIAENMHTSVSNVKQYLFEGRKKVKEGMDMQREYGVSSYAPEKFEMDFWGDSSRGYWELFRRKLPGSLMLAICDVPKTVEELSMEVGVSAIYAEDELKQLEEYELVCSKGGKYRSNIAIYDDKWAESIHAQTAHILQEKLTEITAMVEKGMTLLKDTDYCYENGDENARKWFLLFLIFWEALQESEKKLEQPLTFPLLANGSKGYVMGKRGEFHSKEKGIYGIYGMYGLQKGYIRVINHMLLSDRRLSPFENGYREVFLACEEGSDAPEQLTALPELLENGFVRIKDGCMRLNFAEISERDYLGLKEGLVAEIDAVADMTAKLRNQAGRELERKAPRDIPHVREVGSIVSMWSFLENLVPVMLDGGYAQKGREDQNLSAFYIRKS